MRKLESMDWWSDLVSKKDDYSLRELAEMFGATPGAINTALKRNGITRKPAPPGPRTRRGRKPAPTTVVEAAGTRHAPSKRGGVRGLRKGTAAKLRPYLDQIGVASDATVAELAGVSIQTIARYRNTHSIPSARASKKATREATTAPAPKATHRKRASKVDAYVDLLGAVPDTEIAKMAGVTVNAVRAYRIRRGVAAAPRSSRAPWGTRSKGGAARKAAAPRKAAPSAVAPKAAAPAPAAPSRSAAPKAAPTGVRRAYRITLADRTAIVVASGVVEAARKADAVGEVRGIELLGDVLG